MSASMTPTSWPWSRRASARLTVSDDLPTPPLPDATSMTRVPGSTEIDFPSPLAAGRLPRSSPVSSARSSAVMCVKRTATERTPSRVPTSRRTSPSIFSLSGQPATVSATPTATSPSGESSISRTMRSDTRSRAELRVDDATERLQDGVAGGHAGMGTCEQVGQALCGGRVTCGVDRDAAGEVEGHGVEPALDARRDDREAGLAHDQLGRGEVDRPRPRQGRQRVGAPVGQLAEGQRQRPQQPHARAVPIERRRGRADSPGVGRRLQEHHLERVARLLLPEAAPGHGRARTARRDPGLADDQVVDGPEAHVADGRAVRDGHAEAEEGQAALGVEGAVDGVDDDRRRAAAVEVPRAELLADQAEPRAARRHGLELADDGVLRRAVDGGGGVAALARARRPPRVRGPAPRGRARGAPRRPCARTPPPSRPARSCQVQASRP